GVGWGFESLQGHVTTRTGSFPGETRERPRFSCCSPSSEAGEAGTPQFMLTAEVFSLHLRLVTLAVRGRSASAARPDRSASPGDESDAEVEGGPVHETDTAHRALLEDRSGLGWVVRATRCGRQLRFHGGFLDEGGS